MKKIIFSLLMIVGLILFGCSLAKENLVTEGLKTEPGCDSLFFKEKITTLTQALEKEKLLREKYQAENFTLQKTIDKLEKQLKEINDFYQTILAKEKQQTSLQAQTQAFSQKVDFFKNEISLFEKELKKLLKKNHSLQTENNQLAKELTLTKEILQKTKTSQEVLTIKIVSLFAVVLGAMIVLLALILLKK